MLASRIMDKRTTVSASEDDYLVLEHEARRRGVSVGYLLREAVVKYVTGLRTSRTPRFGIAKGDPGLSQESVDDEDAPHRSDPPGR
jgi:hypothetical protein